MKTILNHENRRRNGVVTVTVIQRRLFGFLFRVYEVLLSECFFVAPEDAEAAQADWRKCAAEEGATTTAGITFFPNAIRMEKFGSAFALMAVKKISCPDLEGAQIIWDRFKKDDFSNDPDFGKKYRTMTMIEIALDAQGDSRLKDFLRPGT